MKPKNSHATCTQSVKAGRRYYSLVVAGIVGAGFMAVLAWSGVVAFQRPGSALPLAATGEVRESQRLGERPAPVIAPHVPVTSYEEVGVAREVARPIKQIDKPTMTPRGISSDVKLDRFGKPIMVKGKPWTGEVFDYRPIVQVRVQTMKTTAYSPDERSCGKWADGITASGKSVWMNGGRLVAADRAIPYGTIMTIPGYNNGKPVQVWDRGGAIKGNRLDLLYPTHEIARKWGVQNKRVVFWQFVETD